MNSAALAVMDLSDHAEGSDAPVIHESQALAAFLSTVNAFLPIAEPDTVSFVQCYSEK
jgi:hypothetical protein